jgi:hypothetical protein
MDKQLTLLLKHDELLPVGRTSSHVGRFPGRKKEGIIALGDLMRLFSGPYFTNRREPDYFAHMGEYATDMIEALDRLENAGAYWRLKWFEKVGFTLAVKLGLK